MRPELLSPEDRTATQAAADIEYVVKRNALNLPGIGRVSQHPLLCLKQLRAQLHESGARVRVTDEARVKMNTRPGTVALQDSVRLAFVVGHQFLDRRRRHYRVWLAL